MKKKTQRWSKGSHYLRYNTKLEKKNRAKAGSTSFGHLVILMYNEMGNFKTSTLYKLLVFFLPIQKTKV